MSDNNYAVSINNQIVVSPAVKALAGSFGGLAEACCLQPIDVVKTRLQLDRVGKYKGIKNCGETIIAEEGVPALWKGLIPFATHLFCKYSLRMGSNAVFQSLLRDKDGNLTDARRLAAGFSAGILEALVIVTPFEVVKIRLQDQKGLAKKLIKIQKSHTLCFHNNPRRGSASYVVRGSAHRSAQWNKLNVSVLGKTQYGQIVLVMNNKDSISNLTKKSSYQVKRSQGVRCRV
eukprot:TRINITY_DN10916_c0_g1_i12.p1 TRINITY_DN10916_c0_g1~~TRINITY_DN10916_c0_g1_i12.p1  ORF type:complete len:232 (-),score=23.83 TRINITY_DN10916_c0_g1_i12:8-703(-)